MAVPYFNYVLSVYEEREVRKEQRRRIREVCDPFDLPDREFQHLFRVNKEMGRYLVEKLREDLQAASEDAIPVQVKILSSVQFLANGGYQRQLGQDHSLCCAQSTMSKFIDEFVKSVYRRLLSEWIKFPATEASRRRIAAGFEYKYGVANVVGAIDCTHVKIFPPPGPQGAQYKNLRKGDHTINVQLISDSDNIIINVNARYPGRVHDAFIWQHSNVRQELKRLSDSRIGSYFLLGDSGYPLEPWLMTPILDAAPDSAEQRYTDWHCKARNTIERTNGYLKGSLRCLGIDRVLHYAPEKASQIIYASCIIYNMMKHFGVELEESEVEPPHDPGIEQSSSNLYNVAQGRRRQIINEYFC